MLFMTGMRLSEFAFSVQSTSLLSLCSEFAPSENFEYRPNEYIVACKEFKFTIPRRHVEESVID